MPPIADAIHKLDQAISRAGGAKVMLRMEEALAIRAVLAGDQPPTCALQAQGLPCACSFANPNCEHRQAG